MRRIDKTTDFSYDEEVNEAAIMFLSFVVTIGVFAWIVSYFV